MLPNEYTDILIRIRRGSRASYPVEAWLSDGSFYEGTLRLPKNKLNDLRASEYQLEQYGHQLFQALFAGPIDTAYKVGSGLAGARSTGHLRIRLLLHSGAPPELHALKWERMCEIQGTRTAPLAISTLTPFSRYTALSRPEPPPLTPARINLLFAIADPTDLSRYKLADIDVEQEVRRLFEAMKEVWGSGRCKATILPGRSGLSKKLHTDLEASGCEVISRNATLDNIAEHLAGQHVFHFLGHGQFKAGQGALFLEGDDGSASIVRDVDLAAKLYRTDLRLVFLAACESAKRDPEPVEGAADAMRPFVGLAPVLVERAGIPAVVAMQEQVSMDAAFKLTGEFYRRLFLEHGTVDRALNEARNFLYGQDQPDWGTPVLYMRLSTGQLAIANPVWVALQAIRDHPDYALFRSRRYVSLPIQAVEVSEGQNPSLLDQPEPETTGTVDLTRAVLRYLETKQQIGSTLLVLILGGPGTSKDTQLKHLGWQTISSSLKSADAGRYLPVYLDLRQYQTLGTVPIDWLEGQILAKLKLFWPDLAARTLVELPEDVCLRILFSAGDSLPEVGKDLLKQMTAMAQEHPGHQYILALQPSSFDWDDLKTAANIAPHVLAIQPLTQRGIRHFLEGQGECGQALLDALYDTYLFDLAGTPYYAVKMLDEAVKGRYPTRRAPFLRQLVDEAIAKMPPSEGMRANAARTLRTMAIEMQRKRITVWPLKEAFQAMEGARAERGYELEALYAAFVKYELLLQVGDEGVRFAYSSLQAYFCALAILDMPDRDEILDDMVESLGSPVRLRWWEETLVIISGFLADSPGPGGIRTLRRLLEPIVYGADLLEGEQLFLVARCLLECRSLQSREEWRDLFDHVVNALRWRSDSGNEPYLPQRLQATQLLAQLGLPEIAVELARRTYRKVRKKLVDEWDYEFSSIRFAAAIALKRMKPAEAEATLTKINPKLALLFKAWQDGQVDEVITYSETTDDFGLQGIAALALGDLHGPLQGRGDLAAAEKVLGRLVAMFMDGDTRQSVRWPVVDALSLLDVATVTERMIEPVLRDLASPGAVTLPKPDKIRKSLAYLIGLLRLRSEEAHKFLVADCLGLQGDQPLWDWRTWSTAIVALGRIADQSDRELLAGIAAGSRQGIDLQALFPEETQRYNIQREAIDALANTGELNTLAAPERDRLATDPGLSPTYYQAIRKIYWRQESRALYG